MMNERMNGLIAYLDRLIALEDTSYNCRREIDECITEVRQELGLAPPNEYMLGEGDLIAVKIEGSTKILYAEGPAHITVERGVVR